MTMSMQRDNWQHRKTGLNHFIMFSGADSHVYSLVDSNQQHCSSASERKKSSLHSHHAGRRQVKRAGTEEGEEETISREITPN